MRRRLLPVLPVLLCGCSLLSGAGQAAAAVPVVTVGGTALAGAQLAGAPLVEVSAPGATEVAFVLDGAYLGTDRTAPFSWRVEAAAGVHDLKVRAERGDVTERSRATFTLVAGPATPVPTAPPAPPVPPAPPAAGTVVSTVAALRTAVARATPGAVITVADGEYVLSPRLTLAASGTPAAPITLRGSRGAVLRSTGVSGDYGLSVTGDSWRVEGLTVAHASKGIVLDGSTGTVLDGVEVHDIGAEGVHFRSCSSDSVLRGSVVRDTGVTSPQYGEGVYVGSASSNWSQYACTDGRDNSERVLIERNVFQHVPAEGADLKEGTDSGTLRGNLFDDVGYSGANSADSAVDAKGNGWLVEGNTVRGGRGAFLDAFQTHSVATGYGTGNVFRGNRVEGALPGYGFALTPALGNTVGCDNTAPGAARGLSSAGCR